MRHILISVCLFAVFCDGQSTTCTTNEAGNTIKLNPVLVCNANTSNTNAVESKVADHENRINVLEKQDGIFLSTQVNCSVAYKGRFLFKSDILMVCDGKKWQSILTTTVLEKRGGSRANPASSCQEIYATGQNISGVYWINPDPSVYRPLRVFCEMQFNGGGWIRVYNMMAMPAGAQSAQKMYDAITRNSPVKVVLSNETTHAIHTQGLRLELYREVVYGWAKSSNDFVSHYGYYKKTQGIKGDCYVDSFCGNGKPIATMTSSPTGTTHKYSVPSNPTYPHVGVAWANYQLVWGYDKDAAPYGNWANWQDTVCCNAAAGKDIRDAGMNWRYSILIR